MMKIYRQTQKNYFLVLIVTMVFGLLLAACGGGGGGGGGSDPTGTTPIPPTVEKGTLIDSAVEGVTSRTSTQSGVTDQNGTFSYLDGEIVSFFVGDILLGSAVGKAVLNPIDLVPGAVDEMNPQVTNIIRFLQTMDEDSNSSNGIRITTEVSNLAGGRTINFNVSISAFETDSNVLTVLSDLTSVLGSPRVLIPSATAQAHLRATLGRDEPTDPNPGGGGSIITQAKIAAGWGHTCVIPSDGTVRCWGNNFSGQLGNGDSPFPSSTPVLVTGIVGAKSISAGGGIVFGHTCVTLLDGSVRCWGANLSGQLGNGNTTTSSTSVRVTGISTATAVVASSGGAHTCALLLDQRVHCWGKNDFGQLGDGTFFNSTRPVQVAGLANATAISAGSGHTCALLSNSTVKCWGKNNSGQLGNIVPDASSIPVPVAGITTATAITAGSAHTCALLSNGTVKCWGYFSMLGNNNEFAGFSIPVLVSEITTATAISAGGSVFNLAHTCALLSNGTVRCWGADTSPGIPGVLGNPIDNGRIPARPIPGLTNAAAVATGGNHACALLSNGTARCWGENGFGQTAGGGIITF